MEATELIKLLSNLSTTEKASEHKSAFTHSHTHSHTDARWILYKEPSCSSGTHTHTWTRCCTANGSSLDSVCWLRSLQHEDWRSRGSNHWPLDWAHPALFLIFHSFFSLCFCILTSCFISHTSVTVPVFPPTVITCPVLRWLTCVWCPFIPSVCVAWKL